MKQLELGISYKEMRFYSKTLSVTPHQPNKEVLGRGWSAWWAAINRCCNNCLEPEGTILPNYCVAPLLLRAIVNSGAGSTKLCNQQPHSDPINVQPRQMYRAVCAKTQSTQMWVTCRRPQVASTLAREKPGAEAHHIIDTDFGNKITMGDFATTWGSEEGFLENTVLEFSQDWKGISQTKRRRNGILEEGNKISKLEKRDTTW